MEPQIHKRALFSQYILVSASLFCLDFKDRNKPFEQNEMYPDSTNRVYVNQPFVT